MNLKIQKKLTLPGIGETMVQLQMLKIKEDVDHAGHSQL